MRRCFFALALLAPSALSQSLPEVDRARLAEAFRLADAVGDSLWAGWSEVPFAVLLVAGEHEFLVRHPRPDTSFALVDAYDGLLRSPVYARPRRFEPDLLAAFPAVGGLSTVVVGTAEQTGQSSTAWVLTLLHEHVHQLQTSQPGYDGAVDALDLADGDTTGMWMLDYPFPYASEEVGERFMAYRRALLAALADPTEAALLDVRKTRAALYEALPARDGRYLAFQVWQEGVARYVEVRAAEAPGEPLPAFRALPDAEPYAVAAADLREQVVNQVRGLDLAGSRRSIVYPVGAAEALLLDATRPGWRARYLAEPFDLGRYAE